MHVNSIQCSAARRRRRRRAARLIVSSLQIKGGARIVTQSYRPVREKQDLENFVIKAADLRPVKQFATIIVATARITAATSTEISL